MPKLKPLEERNPYAAAVLDAFDKLEATEQNQCQEKTEVYSRVCGFFRPVQQWNKGKKSEYKDRTPYRPSGTDLKSDISNLKSRQRSAHGEKSQ